MYVFWHVYLRVLADDDTLDYDVDAMTRMRQSNDSATVSKQIRARVYFILKRDRSLFIANADERATSYRSKSIS